MTSTHSHSRSAARPAGPKLRDSCEVCASSKIKCSKEKPTCARCAKRGLRCEYFEAKRAGRKHRLGKKPQNEGSDRDDNSDVYSLQNNDEDNDDDNATNASVSNDNFHSPTTDMFMLTGSTPSTTIPSSAPPGMSDTFPTSDLSFQQSHHTPSHPDLFSSLFTFSPAPNPPPSTVVPQTANPNLNFDDFFTSPFSSGAMDTMDTSMDTSTPSTFAPSSNMFSLPGSAPQSHSSFSGSGTPATSLSDDMFSNMLGNMSLPGLGPSISHDSGSVASLSDIQCTYPYRSDSPSTPCCLVKALGLIKELFPNASPACTSADGSVDNLSNQPRSIQVVIADNKETTDAVSQIFQCSCSHSPYLLLILAVIVFKVMGWYAAAVSETQSRADGAGGSPPNPDLIRRSSSVHSELVLPEANAANYVPCANVDQQHEDQSRLTAQLVLSELHRVQRLVSHLSERLKASSSRSTLSGLNTPNSSADTHTDRLASSLLEPVPFSTTMLVQLESDLRTRLRTLSQTIVEILRRG